MDSSKRFALRGNTVKIGLEIASEMPGRPREPARNFPIQGASVDVMHLLESMVGTQSVMDCRDADTVTMTRPSGALLHECVVTAIDDAGMQRVPDAITFMQTQVVVRFSPQFSGRVFLQHPPRLPSSGVANAQLDITASLRNFATGGFTEAPRSTGVAAVPDEVSTSALRATFGVPEFMAEHLHQYLPLDFTSALGNRRLQEMQSSLFRTSYVRRSLLNYESHPAWVAQMERQESQPYVDCFIMLVITMARSPNTRQARQLLARVVVDRFDTRLTTDREAVSFFRALAQCGLMGTLGPV